MIDLADSKPELEDSPEPNTTTHTPEPNTSMNPPRQKRKYTKRAPHVADIGGTDQSGNDVPPEGYGPTGEVEKQVRQAHQALVNDLAQFYWTVGAVLSGASPLAGGIIMDKSGDRARELVNACKRNPTAIKWLKRMTKSSDVATCVIGHAAMVVAILVAVDKLPLNQRYGTILHATGYDAVIGEKIKQMEATNGAPVAA